MKNNLNNKFIESYCNHFELKVLLYNKINIIQNKHEVPIGYYKHNSKYISFLFESKNKIFKKSDLVQFILNNIKAHA